MSQKGGKLSVFITLAVVLDSNFRRLRMSKVRYLKLSDLHVMPLVRVLFRIRRKASSKNMQGLVYTTCPDMNTVYSRLNGLSCHCQTPIHVDMLIDI